METWFSAFPFSSGSSGKKSDTKKQAKRKRSAVRELVAHWFGAVFCWTLGHLDTWAFYFASVAEGFHHGFSLSSQLLSLLFSASSPLRPPVFLLHETRLGIVGHSFGYGCVAVTKERGSKRFDSSRLESDGRKRRSSSSSFLTASAANGVAVPVVTFSHWRRSGSRRRAIRGRIFSASRPFSGASQKTIESGSFPFSLAAPTGLLCVHCYL